MSRRIITGIDIGTATVRVAVAEPRGGEISTAFSLLGYGMAPMGGMRRGFVVDVGEVANSIRQAVSNAERHAGVAIGHAYVGFGGAGFGSVLAKGVVAVSRADGEISEADVERVHAAARANLPTMQNREIIHEVVVQYMVDKEGGAKQPVGMIGNRLEAHILFLTAFTPHVRSLVRAVEHAGITVDDVTASPLVSAFAVLSKHQREIGALHLDLGAGTASCTVFEEGTLISACVFPVGAMHITHDIAIGFQAPLEVAEHIKLAHGLVAADLVLARRELVRFADYAPELAAVVSRADLSEIIEARVADIFELVEKHLRKIGRAGLLPSGVILSGGGAHLEGMVEFARRSLRLPAEVGTIRLLDSAHDLASDPSWAVAVGLCAWASGEEDKNRIHSFLVKKLGSRLMRVIQPFIP